MKKKKINKICVFTGSRSEYGLLRPLLCEIKKNKEFSLQLLVSCMHLSPEFGLTYKDIEKDNFKINEKIEILLSSDTNEGILKSMGLGLIGFADALKRLKPTMAIVLGDRFESLIFAICCYINKIILIHLNGGEITEGSLDDGFRHCITKLSHIHFVSTEEYKRNVIQLGENPENVYVVGDISIDNIKNMNFLNFNEIEKKIGIKFKRHNFLITFHPPTIEEMDVEKQIKNLLEALDEFEDTLLIFTKSNADPKGRIINKYIENYVKKNKSKAVLFTSMGQLFYLSTIRYVDAVIGNSSSGIVEVPYFKVPTVNIGSRQNGRIKTESIIDCDYDKNSIIKAINLALSEDFREKIKNINFYPYGDGNTSKKILDIIRNLDFDKIKKSFFKI
ncbi:MAG: UDP-N-acetylglucosamine 2-epimerase [Spirochaetes bacterium]|nr:UDP-N-acetylglucosamine 2-epimerase [Spirochaetota bacterium]